tara:strand:+ start:273 stop:2039 length:1767 start_codon:yes stop_codon:yes gene_type:complete
MNDHDPTLDVPVTAEEYDNISKIQQQILEQVASDQPNSLTLNSLCVLAESLLPSSVASIMILDKTSDLISVLSAPSVPQAGHDALANLHPGPHGGSCGNAVFHNKAQFVQNTFEDSRWQDLRQFAYDFNLCSCWSMPIRDKNKQAIGSFALSSFEHRTPALFHQKLLEMCAAIVSIILTKQQAENQIIETAFRDSITNLYNKSSLEKHLFKNQQDFTLILLNINNFSYINTAYGFDTGDHLLINIAGTLVDNFNAHNVYRLNSDEYALLFGGDLDIELQIQEIQQYFDHNLIKVETILLNISFTYGAAFGNEKLLRNSALALKQAKEEGKNCYHIFENGAESIGHAQRELFIEANYMLRTAIDQDRIVPYFQGIYNNKTGDISKFEALVRIEENGEIISPNRFLEPARLSGLLPEITRIMIDKSFKVMAQNNNRFSINITEDDLSRNYLVNYLEQKVAQYKIASQRVILEILEGVSLTGKQSNLAQLKQLKKLGFSLAIDDFGTEYSNFERILDLDIDFLKIDAKYIKDIDINKKSYEITRAIVFFAKNANIPCIAEFVHNDSVQKIVYELGIDYSQGYYFSEPAPFK